MLPALRHPYDVAILGSGLVGSMLGAILARNGARVVVIEPASQPRVAIGESTTPLFLVGLRVLAERYGVPEIATLTDVRACNRRIGRSFGVKRHSGFLLHREGQEPDPAETNMIATPRLLTRAAHLFRSDSDAYMFRVAAEYGCDTRQGWQVLDIDLDEAGVTLVGENDELYRARFLVDTTGSGSPLARKLALRERPCRFEHQSRSIFTHMVGVTPLDAVLRHERAHRPPLPWHDGTVHHVFEHGWLWVVPFGNHPRSSNPLCSVGLVLDTRHHPRNLRISPQEEFWHHVGRFPAVARQLAEARPVREWTITGRLQYSATSSVGYRWCLLSHATGFVDPLFSMGLAGTAEVVNALAWRLLASITDDDFSRDRFEYVEHLERGLLDCNDDLVSSAYIAFSHYRLWDAVLRVWALAATPSAMRLWQRLLRSRRTGQYAELNELEAGKHVGLWWPDHDGFAELFGLVVLACRRYEAGDLTGDEAADQILAAVREARFVPPQGWKQPARRFIVPGVWDAAKLAGWAALAAPGQVRGYTRGIAGAVLGEVLRPWRGRRSRRSGLPAIDGW